MKADLKRGEVEYWLDNFTNQSGLTETKEDIVKTMRRSWTRKNKDFLESMYLEGNKCQFEGNDVDNDVLAKERNSRDFIPKRVTFKSNPHQADIGTDHGCKDDPNKVTNFRLMRLKQHEDRLELAKNMTRHLMGVHQRKLHERSPPFVYESPRNKSKIISAETNTRQETNSCDLSDDAGCLQTSAEGQDAGSIGNMSGERQNSSRRHHRKPNRSFHRVVKGSQKPTIDGLVVDSASNQKPSIVRASKNANIREEFALQQKIAGYQKSCSHNINTIKIAQRRLSTSLQRLRSKMAQNKMDEQQMLEFRNTSDQLFLRNKGYMPTRKESSAHFCFPPLNYQTRRSLTVH